MFCNICCISYNRNINALRATTVTYSFPHSSWNLVVPHTYWGIFKYVWIKLMVIIKRFVCYWKGWWLKIRQISCSTSSLRIFCWGASSDSLVAGSALQASFLWFPEWRLQILFLFFGSNRPNHRITRVLSLCKSTSSFADDCRHGVGIGVSLDLFILCSKLVVSAAFWLLLSLLRAGEGRAGPWMGGALLGPSQAWEVPSTSVKPSSLLLRAGAKAYTPLVTCMTFLNYRQSL